MRIKLKGSMGYAGTDCVDYEEIPSEILEIEDESERNKLIEEYAERSCDFFWQALCEQVSVCWEIEK